VALPPRDPAEIGSARCGESRGEGSRLGRAGALHRSGGPLRRGSAVEGDRRRSSRAGLLLGPRPPRTASLPAGTAGPVPGDGGRPLPLRRGARLHPAWSRRIGHPRERLRTGGRLDESAHRDRRPGKIPPTSRLPCDAVAASPASPS
jgi:hypothetical protein